MHSTTGIDQKTMVECSNNCVGIIVPYSEERAIEIPVMLKSKDGTIFLKGHYLRINKTGTIQTVRR